MDVNQVQDIYWIIVYVHFSEEEICSLHSVLKGIKAPFDPKKVKNQCDICGYREQS